MPERPGTARITTWRRRSPGGGGSLRCADRFRTSRARSRHPAPPCPRTSRPLSSPSPGQPSQPGPRNWPDGAQSEHAPDRAQPTTAEPMEDQMKSARLAAVIGTAALTAAGLAVLAGCGTSTKAPAAAAKPSSPAYSYYRSMMGRYAGPMMGGGTGYGGMMGVAGYRSMIGGTAAPAWMRGHALPGYMMGTAHDPGQVMGALWANGPGPRVSPGQAAR